MTWLNESEIDQMLERLAYYPYQEFLPYAQYLSDWRHTINANSDGWCYWKIASRSAGKLQTLIHDLDCWIRYGGDAPHRLPQLPKPTHEQFRKALTPIKSFATRHKLPAPTLKTTTVAHA